MSASVRDSHPAVYCPAAERDRPALSAARGVADAVRAGVTGLETAGAEVADCAESHPGSPAVNPLTCANAGRGGLARRQRPHDPRSRSFPKPARARTLRPAGTRSHHPDKRHREASYVCPATAVADLAVTARAAGPP